MYQDFHFYKFVICDMPVMYIIFSAASRGSATARLGRHSSIVLQIATEHLTEKPSKPLPDRSQNGAESQSILGTMTAPKRDLFWGGAAARPVTHVRIHGLHFGSRNRKQNVKNQSANHLKNEHPKTRILTPKECPKGIKVDAKTHPKSILMYVSTDIMKNINNHIFMNHSKTCEN